MTRLLRRAVPALIVLTLAAAAAACGTAPFTSGETPDVHAAAAERGLAVLDSGSAKNYYPGGVDAQWYEIARKGSSTPAAVVGVLTFDSRRARDGAFRQVQFRMDRVPNTVVYTAGDAVIEIGRINDWGMVTDLAHQMEAAGAL